MNHKCRNCNLVNYADAQNCARCGNILATVRSPGSGSSVLRRIFVLLAVIMVTVAGFYASLIFSATKLTSEERRTVQEAIKILEKGGFTNEVFLLKRLAVYRSNDNWFNASVVKENAFAATNFPFEIVTLYPEFFTYPADSVEQAVILLHEAKHLEGADEPEAYEFVWRNRKRIGWTEEKYGASEVWQGVRKQTRDQVPKLFICDFNTFGDCTQ